MAMSHTARCHCPTLDPEPFQLPAQRCPFSAAEASVVQMWPLDLPPADVPERGCGRGWPLCTGLLGAVGSSGLVVGIREPERGSAFCHLESSRCPEVCWPWWFYLTCFSIPDPGAERVPAAPRAQSRRRESSPRCPGEGGFTAPLKPSCPRPALAGTRGSPRNTSSVLDEEFSIVRPLAPAAKLINISRTLC